MAGGDEVGYSARRSVEGVVPLPWSSPCDSRSLQNFDVAHLGCGPGFYARCVPADVGVAVVIALDVDGSFFTWTDARVTLIAGWTHVANARVLLWGFVIHPLMMPHNSEQVTSSRQRMPLRPPA